MFGCRPYRWYGHSERVVLAGEGRSSDLFYFTPQYGFVEFGPSDAAGLREVIGTSFHNMAMPLVRYRTGDYVRIVEESVLRGPWSVVPEYQRQTAPGHSAPATDPSGRPKGDERSKPASLEQVALEFPWPAVSEISGREQEFLVSATGRRISLTAFNMHDSIFDDLYAVQFYQDAPGRAEFRYISGPGFHSSRLGLIETAIRRKLGDDFEIELRPVREVEKTARGKHRWLVSKLNL